MQIRLTVLGGHASRGGGRPARSSDVLVTAPAGTPLGAVAGALASGSGSGQPARGSTATPALYAGAERLDPKTAVLGVPPLVDGAILSLHTPADQHADPPSAPAAARLHVVGGPDAGGVHLLQGGQVRVGRSADADVPLDDPDVSRLHCAVTVAPDGQVTVADLRSTNGTAVDGFPVGERPVPLAPGALLRVGESTLRLARTAPGSTVPPPPPSVPAIPDSDGHLRVSLPPAAWVDRLDDGRPGRRGDEAPGAPGAPGVPSVARPPYGQGHHPGTPLHRAADIPGVPHPRGGNGSGAARRDTAPGNAPYDSATARGSAPGASKRTPARGTPHPPADSPGPGGTPDAGRPYGHDQAGHAVSGPGGASTPGVPGSTSHGLGGAPGVGRQRGHAADGSDQRRDTPWRGSPGPADGRAYEVPYAGADTTPAIAIPPQSSRPLEKTLGGGRFGGVAGAISTWARRLATGSSAAVEAPGDLQDRLEAEAAALRERWPDAAAVLLTALGPGPRLWERGPGHQDALTVRLGTTDLPALDGSGSLTAVPFTVSLRSPEAFTLGLAGPRPRLASLARSVLAQAAALHPPSALELVLISADRSRPAEQRAEEWAWLNWLPHLRPAHGQDCRLLLAFDREQAEARTAELVRRLVDGPLGAGWVTAESEAVAGAAARYEGPHTLIAVDGDPGSAALRESVARIAAAGPSIGAHVLCVAERPELLAAECGTVAELDGDVATTLRIAPQDPGRLTLDAVSQAWAERFARALAPLREGDMACPAVRGALPDTARLLDELDLALATPSKITARWTAAPATASNRAGSSQTSSDRAGSSQTSSNWAGSDRAGSDRAATGQALAGQIGAATATAVLGAGSDGRVLVDLAGEGPHLMAGGAPGSGKTELLRSITAALAAAERPDRLTVVLVDGAGHERGEGLRLCTDLPHVSTYLSASDPVLMREFAQALTTELKRRESALADGGPDTPAPGVPLSLPLPRPRQTSAGRTDGRTDGRAEGGRSQAPPTRTRLAASPRLVVVVDDLDALVAPPLGSTGRPAAGSVVRALEAVARDGGRLGVHLVASTGRPERTAGTEVDERSRLRIALRTQDPESAALLVHIEDPAGLDDAVPGRGYLRRPTGAVVPFQTGRVSGRIPRTATLRPTVVPLDWTRMGDPPTRRPVRELGNGPTDLALLASALQRASESAGADPVPPLL